MADLNSNEIQERMNKGIESFKKDLSSLRVGRASSSMLDPINVNAYGSILPLNQTSTVSVPESRLLLVSVWDNSLVSFVEKAIRESSLGLNPMVEGNIIRIAVPPLSEDRRIELTKVAAKYAENSKISIRNIRRDANSKIKEMLKKKEISEDDEKQANDHIQKITDSHINSIDLVLKDKEADLMQV